MGPSTPQRAYPPPDPGYRFRDLGMALGCMVVGSSWCFERYGRTFALDLKRERRADPWVGLSTSVGPVSLPPIPLGGQMHQAAAGLAQGPVPRRILCPGPMVMRQETGSDRFGKRVGLNRETSTGDAAFDDAVYLQTEAPEALVREFLANPGVRQAVVRIVAAQGKVELTADGKVEIWLRVTDADMLLLPRIVPVIDELYRIAEALPPAFAGKGPPFSFADGAFLLVCFGSVLAPVGSYLIGPRWLPIDSSLFWIGIGLGALCWLVMGLIMARILRGRSIGYGEFCVAMVLLLVGCPVVTTEILPMINGLGDLGPPSFHVAKVVRKFTKGRKTKTYHATLTSWRRGEKTVDIRVVRGVWGWATEGGNVVVTTRPGLLGWEWVVAVGSEVPR